MAHLLALSERLLAFLPWGEEGWWGGVGGLTEEMSLYLSLSLSHKQEAGPLMASSSRAF